MSRKVLKYVILANDEESTVAFSGKILHVAPANHNLIEIYAEQDDEQPEQNHTFRVLGTGHDVPFGSSHVQSVRSSMGVIFHLYELDYSDG